MTKTDKRILTLSDHTNDGDAVVYVMYRDQRVKDNHALLAAQADALDKKVPLVVLFNLYVKNGFRSREHYDYMLAGLDEVASDLRDKNIPFIFKMGNQDGEAVKNTLALLKEVNAASVYFDFSPLDFVRQLAKDVSKDFDGEAYVVDTHNIIPVWVTSDKQEFAAHTIRRKVNKHLEDYVKEPDTLKKHPHDFSKQPKGLTKKDLQGFLDKVDKSGVDIAFDPGEKAGHAHVKDFIKNGLDRYALDRNDATKDALSNISPYLHFGQVSSLRIALMVMDAVDEVPMIFRQAKMPQAGDNASKADGMNALFEEMIVRKELSDNFCFYAKSYTDLKSIPDWAVKTLNKHKKDKRDFTYSQKEWEAAKTHDDAWNASQNQLAKTGKLHGYMRMYWAKKILEWSSSPEHAIDIAIYLNDHYSLDGGDPNGYVGILWSIAGLHDRPWTERSVFGEIRYMNSDGLKRKFKIQDYIDTWS